MLKINALCVILTDRLIDGLQIMQISQLTNIKKYLIVATSMVMAVSATAVNAQEVEDNGGAFFGSKAPGKWTIGIRAARIDPNIEGIDDADAAGVVVGYEFATAIGSFKGTSAIELEYLQSDDTQLFAGSTANYDAESLGLFFTYRSAGQVYFKLKGGLVVNTLQAEGLPPAQTPDFQSTTIRDLESTNLAIGIGVGVRITDRASIELDYLQEAGSNDFVAQSDSDFAFAQQDGGTDLGVISLTGQLKF